MAMDQCDDEDVKALLQEYFQVFNPPDRNTTVLCAPQNESINDVNLVDDVIHENRMRFNELGRDIYAYMTPVIFCIGLTGNAISLRVFTSKVMRRLSSSLYLLALSASDMLVLVTYVLIDWLNHGLIRWPGNHRLPLKNHDGACQLFLYLSYIFRLLSAWYVVAFAIERYIYVCWPAYRKRLCTRTIAKRIIGGTAIVACVLCVYKPLLSEVSTKHVERTCTRREDYARASFILDGIYGLIITAVPSVVIVALNLPILKRLMSWGHSNPAVKESKIRLEFTVILLSISTCFICLNLPYLVIWCQEFYLSLNPQSPSAADRMSGKLYITRTIFYLNYSINFFLYVMTAAYYRREIKSVCRYYRNQARSESTKSDHI